MMSYLYGIKEEILKHVVSEKHRIKIAQIIIGEDWEYLAPFLGIPDVEIDEIKERYVMSPKNRRLAMIRRWHEMYGSSATYHKLIKVLEQTGRRDLCEAIIMELKQSDIVSRVPYQQDNIVIKLSKRTIVVAICSAITIIIVLAALGLYVALSVELCNCQVSFISLNHNNYHASITHFNPEI